MPDKPAPNVIVSPEDIARIKREEQTWSGPRLVGLAAVTLGLALTLLYVLASLSCSQG